MTSNSIPRFSCEPMRMYLANVMSELKDVISDLDDGNNDLMFKYCTLVDPTVIELNEQESDKRLQTAKMYVNEGHNSGQVKRRTSCDILAVDFEGLTGVHRKPFSIQSERIDTRATVPSTTHESLNRHKTEKRRYSEPNIVNRGNSLTDIRVKFEEATRRMSDCSQNNERIQLNNTTRKKSLLPDKWYAFRDKLVQENKQDWNSLDRSIVCSVSKSEQTNLCKDNYCNNDSIGRFSPHLAPRNSLMSTSDKNLDVVKDSKHQKELHQINITECDTETVNEHINVHNTDVNMHQNSEEQNHEVPLLKPLRSCRRKSSAGEESTTIFSDSFHDTEAISETDLLSKSMNINLSLRCDGNSGTRGRIDGFMPTKEHHTRVNGNNMNNTLTLPQQHSNDVLGGGSILKARRSSLPFDKDLTGNGRNIKHRHSMNSDLNQIHNHLSPGRRNSVAFGNSMNDHVILTGRKNSLIAPIDHMANDSGALSVGGSVAQRRHSLVSVTSDATGRSSMNEKSKLGQGRHSIERHRQKHDYPLRIQKFLQAQEKEMPTSTLLEIKRLKERLKYGEN